MQSNAVMPAGNKSFTLFISGNDSLSLRSGEVVKAEVLSIGPGNTASIRVNKAVLEVRTEVPVQKGELLTLRVEKQENIVSLRLAGGASDSTDPLISAVLPALKGFQDLAPGAVGLTRLVALLTMLPAGLRENMPEIGVAERALLAMDQLSGQALKDVIQNGGVFFETKLRILAYGMETEGSASDAAARHYIAGDLKAALLRLKETVLYPRFLDETAQSGVKTNDLLDALNGVLRNIEFYQLQSKLTDSLLFFLPLVWEALKDGELVMREVDRGPGSRTSSCSIYLDLERAGRVRVNLLLRKHSLQVDCAAENDELCRLLRDNSGLLESRIESSGLRLGSLSIHHETTIDFETHRAAGISIRA